MWDNRLPFNVTHGAEGVSVGLANLCPLHRQDTFLNYAGDSDSDASDAVYENPNTCKSTWCRSEFASFCYRLIQLRSPFLRCGTVLGEKKAKIDPKSGKIGL